MNWKIFTILWVFTALPAAYGLRCGICHAAEHLHHCQSSVECNSQECFLEIRDHGSHKDYTAGCGSVASCGASNAGLSIVGRGDLLRMLKRNKPTHNVCSMCCTTDMCNIHEPHCASVTINTTSPTAPTAQQTTETSTLQATTFAVPNPETTVKTTYATPPTDKETTTTAKATTTTLKATTFAVPNPDSTVKTTYATPPTDKETTTTAKATIFAVPNPDSTVKTTYATPPTDKETTTAAKTIPTVSS